MAGGTHATDGPEVELKTIISPTAYFARPTDELCAEIETDEDLRTFLTFVKSEASIGHVEALMKAFFVVNKLLETRSPGWWRSVVNSTDAITAIMDICADKYDLHQADGQIELKVTPANIQRLIVLFHLIAELGIEHFKSLFSSDYTECVSIVAKWFLRAENPLVPLLDDTADLESAMATITELASHEECLAGVQAQEERTSYCAAFSVLQLMLVLKGNDPLGVLCFTAAASFSACERSVVSLHGHDFVQNMQAILSKGCFTFSTAAFEPGTTTEDGAAATCD